MGERAQVFDFRGNRGSGKIAGAGSRAFGLKRLKYDRHGCGDIGFVEFAQRVGAQFERPAIGAGDEPDIGFEAIEQDLSAGDKHDGKLWRKRAVGERIVADGAQGAGQRARIGHGLGIVAGQRGYFDGRRRLGGNTGAGKRVAKGSGRRFGKPAHLQIASRRDLDQPVAMRVCRVGQRRELVGRKPCFRAKAGE